MSAIRTSSHEFQSTFLDHLLGHLLHLIGLLVPPAPEKGGLYLDVPATPIYNDYYKKIELWGSSIEIVVYTQGDWVFHQLTKLNANILKILMRL